MCVSVYKRSCSCSADFSLLNTVRGERNYFTKIHERVRKEISIIVHNANSHLKKRHRVTSGMGHESRIVLNIEKPCLDYLGSLKRALEILKLLKVNLFLLHLMSLSQINLYFIRRSNKLFLRS